MRDTEPRRHYDNRQQHRADPEEPSPVQVFARDPGQKDPKEESEWCATAVKAEDRVFPWARPISSSEQHHAGRHERCSTSSLKRTAEDQHQEILAKTSDQRPNGHPDKTTYEDDVSTVYICKAAEGKEKSSSDEREDIGRPGPIGRIDMELFDDVREQDVEATDQEFLERMYSQSGSFAITPADRLERGLRLGCWTSGWMRRTRLRYTHF